MSGFLRFAGLANAAVWFGAAVFYTLCVAPTMASDSATTILGARNFPYYGGALGQLLLARYLQLTLVCATLALAHLVAERLYLGRSARKIWNVIIVTLFWISIGCAVWIGPKLREWHQLRHLGSTPPAQREVAIRAFNFWNGVFQGLNVFVLVGVAGCLWRATIPPDELRFFGSNKFRG